MPKPPDGVLQRLNYVADFLFDPCDAPFTLYVETMLPALLEAAILWYSPVPDEIFTAWARPSRAMGRLRSARKGTRGSKSGRKGPKTRLGKIIAFDTNEFIGKRLPGAELLGEATLFRGTFFLWRIFGALQLLGFIWLVWEVISGFWVKWFSLLYETEYCQASAMVIFDGRGTGTLIGEGLNPLQAPIIEKQRGPVSYSLGSGQALARNVHVAASVLVEGNVPAGAYVDLVFMEGGYGGPIVGEFRTPVSGSSTGRTAAGGHTFKAGGSFGVGIRTNQGLLFITETTVYIQGSPDP